MSLWAELKLIDVIVDDEKLNRANLPEKQVSVGLSVCVHRLLLLFMVHALCCFVIVWRF